MATFNTVYNTVRSRWTERNNVSTPQVRVTYFHYTITNSDERRPLHLYAL